MARGGKREGAGRPKGSKDAQTLNKELAREKLRELVFQHLYPMTESQIASAKGIHYLVVREIKTGKFVKRVIEDEDLIVDDQKEVIEVYAKDPSAQAYSYLLDQAIDKATNPPQVVEVGIRDLGDRIKAARERIGKRS
jgi:hypothetical protein